MSLVKYFPFAPGIPWKVLNNKYVIPELNSEFWHKAVANKKAVVVANGGLIESFISLFYIEAINCLTPPTSLIWHGDAKFNDLIQLQGLAKISEVNISQHVFSNYPTPLFFDKNSNVYFNCLNNYLEVKTWYGSKGYKDRRPIINQLFRNSLVEWDERYKVKFRSDSGKKDITQWLRLSKFDMNKPYVCIFTQTGLSQHKKQSLDWNINQLKAFAAMLKQVGVSTIVFTNNKGKYYDGQYHCLPIKFDFIIHFLQSSLAILSYEIDFLLMGAVITTSKLICKQLKNELNLKRNLAYLKCKNVIYENSKLTPLLAFNAVREKET